VDASTRYSFRRVEQNIIAIFPWEVCHTTIHSFSRKAADSYIAEEKKKVNALFEDGIIPQSEGKVVPYLVVEADGVSPALQKGQERRAEIKVGIAHEGWQQISKERYRLKEKSVCRGIMSGGRFWEGFSLTLARKYHLAQIGKLIVDGDGAPWDHHLPILYSDKTEARLDPFLYKFYTIADRVSQQYGGQDEAFYQRTIWNQASAGSSPSLGRRTGSIERHCPKAGDFTAVPRASDYPPCSGKDSEEHPWASWWCLSSQAP